jgi:hypothetical protein
MTREEELLLEEVTTAHRERHADGSVKSHPAWHDLDEAGKREAFEAARRSMASRARLPARR